MIASIVKGRGFGGLFRYLFQAHDSSGEVRPEVAFLGATVPGDTPAALTMNMHRVADLRKSVKKPVRHWMLAFAPEDAGKYDKETMREIGARFADEMGASAYAMVSHGDHLHIVANAVTHSGEYVTDRWDYAKAQDIVRRIEKDYGLRVVRSTHELESRPDGTVKVRTVAPPADHAPTQAEINMDEPSARLGLQRLVKAAAEGGPTMTAFVERLEAAGVAPRIMVNKSGWYGVSFAYAGYAFKGQDLGAAYKAKALQADGVTYDQEADRACAERCSPSRAGADAGPADGRNPGEAPGSGGDAGAGRPGDDGQRREAGPERGASGVRAGGVDGEARRLPDAGRNGYAGGGPGDRGRSQEVAGGGGDLGGPRQDIGGHGAGDSRQRTGGDGGGDRATTQRTGRRDGAHLPDDVGSLVRRDGAYARVLGVAVAFAGDHGAGLGGGAEAGDAVQRRATGRMQAIGGGTFAQVTGERIRAQLDAMGVERVEVGILPPKDRADLSPMPFKNWTAAEVADPKNVRYLAAMNAKGYEIYVKPTTADKDNKGIVFLDDLNAEKVAALEAAGFAPSVVVESSPGNLQAWVRLADHPLSQDEAREAAKRLAADFGGDPNSAAWSHFGRLAGFTNRKAKHADTQGRGPFVHLRRAAAVVAEKGNALVAQVRGWLADKAKAEEAKRLADLEARNRYAAALRAEQRRLTPAEAFTVFRAQVRTAKEGDESARDFGAAVRMASAGYDTADIAKAIVDASPELAERKGREVQRYAERTAENAAAKAQAQGPRYPR